MINIERFFENHLSNRQISGEELRQFTEDHIGKLKAMPALPANLAALRASKSYGSSVTKRVPSRHAFFNS
jgi:hypothetical protein